MHCTSRSLLTSVFSPAFHRTPTAPLSFLTPTLSLSQSAPFSSTPIFQLRKRGEHDRNPNRGVSALRRTGLRRRQTLSVSLANLPQPVLDPLKRSAIEVDDDHGLWEFLNRDRAALSTPSQLAEHGRGWTAAELRRKDWDDLWRLWWMCVKERNRLLTLEIEMERIGNLMGKDEREARGKEIKKTMKAIRHVLTERWYAWEDARVAAMDDPEVNLEADIDNGERAFIRTPKHQKVAETLDSKIEAVDPGQVPPPPSGQMSASVRPSV